MLTELTCTLIGATAGAWASWLLTGKHYRKLISEMIARNCSLISEMRTEPTATATATGGVAGRETL